jgi:hypothetical protein
MIARDFLGQKSREIGLEWVNCGDELVPAGGALMPEQSRRREGVKCHLNSA